MLLVTEPTAGVKVAVPGTLPVNVQAPESLFAGAKPVPDRDKLPRLPTPDSTTESAL